MLNKVNYLNGKEWLKNAVNFWIMEDNIIDSIYNRFKSFCYKDRTGNGCLKNIDNIEIRSSDFSFNYFKNEQDINKIISTILAGEYDSYHVVLLDCEIYHNKFVIPCFTKNLEKMGIEYRGKIIIKLSDNNLKIALLFLNRLGKKENEFITEIFSCENYNFNFNHVIDSKSKIDKIGLMHPAPYSYLDIRKIVDIEKIENCLILDPFLGIGSTIIGTYQKNRNIGIELNENYIELIYKRFCDLNLPKKIFEDNLIICGDSLQEIENIEEDINIVITSPPYFNILKNKTSGVRSDNSQTRQGIQYYSDDEKDIGNINEYDSYIQVIKKLFYKIRKKMSKNGKIYIVLSDFTVNKKEKDVHSDYVLALQDIGYIYSGTSYIYQSQKTIYPFGYPYKIVINHIYQYVMKFEVLDSEKV